MTSLSWVRFFALLAAEASLTLFLAFLISRLARPVWQRAIWHAAMVGLLVLLAMECTGATRWLPTIDASQSKEPQPERRFAVTTFPAKQDLSDRLKNQALLKSGANVHPNSRSKSDWWPAWLWLVGTGLLSTWSLLCRVWFLRRASERESITDSLLLERIQKLAQQLRIRRPVRMTQSQQLTSPVAYGILRPGICLPANFTSTFSIAQQEAILAHELAHLSSRDPAWYCLVDLVAALWWWHPLVWWSRRQLQSATEFAADESSLLVQGGPETLAECLVQMGRALTGRRAFHPLGVKGNGFRSGLGRRVARLLSLRNHLPRTVSLGKAILLHCGSMCLLLLLVFASSGWTSRDPSLATMAWDALTSQEQPLLLAQTTPPKQKSLAVNPYVPGPPEVDPVTGLPLTNAVTGLPNTNNSGSGTLHTRWFKVDPTTFLESVKNGDAFIYMPRVSNASGVSTNSSEAVIEAVARFFKTAGVDLSPPKALFYNNRVGTLMIRGTLQDLDIVEQAIQVLSMSPPQLTIECKFIEFPVAGSLTTWFQEQGLRLVGKTLPADRSSTDSSRPSALKVLTPALYREMLKQTEQEPGAVTLATPKITTLSGRQAQIKVVDVKSVVTNLSYSQPTTGAAPVAQPMVENVEIGPSLDVVPYVSADGYTISLTLISGIKDFLGYDHENAKKMLSLVPNMGVEPPLPMFRHRTAVSSSIAWDGQTVLVYLGSFEGTPESGSMTTKHRIVLVTPTIIDPAGNRVHTDADGPFRMTGTPPQPTSEQ